MSGGWGVFLASPGGDFLPEVGGGAAISSIALFSVRVAVLSIPGVTWSARLVAWQGLLCQEFPLTAARSGAGKETCVGLSDVLVKREQACLTLGMQLPAGDADGVRDTSVT